MGTVRKLAAGLACTAMLGVIGATTAGAQRPPKCEHLAQITERIEAKGARITARAAESPRGEKTGQKHKAKLEAKAQDKLAAVQARCSA